jgi:hypothetical protein
MVVQMLNVVSHGRALSGIVMQTELLFDSRSYCKLGPPQITWTPLER